MEVYLEGVEEVYLEGEEEVSVSEVVLSEAVVSEMMLVSGQESLKVIE